MAQLVDQLTYTTFSEEVRELLDVMQQEVRVRRGYFRRLSDIKDPLMSQVEGIGDVRRAILDDPEIHISALSENLDGILNALTEDLKSTIGMYMGDARKVRAAIAEDLMKSDNYLKELGLALAGTCFAGPTRRKYVVITKCFECADSNKKRLREDSKRRQLLDVKQKAEDNRQPVFDEKGRAVYEYIHELDFDAAIEVGMDHPELEQEKLILTCPTCESPMKILNKSNVIYPANEEVIHAIVQRVKSAGRYCQKLVDLIFYDKADPLMEERSISDRYASAVIVNYPVSLTDSAFVKSFNGQFEKFMSKQFDRFFKRNYGYDPRTLLLEDRTCYKLHNAFRHKFELIGSLDDKIKEPKTRKSKKRRNETFKMLQFDVLFGGMRFETQIKTLGMYLRELDRKSLVSHEYYEQIEADMRENMFMRAPETKAVYDLLRQMFGR
jgi:hypothetical protein